MNWGHKEYTLEYLQEALDISKETRNILKEVQSPHLSEIQSQIDTLHKTLGDEQFASLLTQVEPQASQIVEKTLAGEK